MDERLQQALEFANYKQTLNNQLHKVRTKAEGMLLFADAGGKFTVSQELICFLDYLVRAGYTDAVLLDDYGTPIHIADTTEFLKKITTRYFEVTNDYLKESQNIRKSRNVMTILDIKPV